MYNLVESFQKDKYWEDYTCTKQNMPEIYKMALQQFWIQTPRYEQTGTLRSPDDDRLDKVQKPTKYTVFGPPELSVWYNKLHSTPVAYFSEIKDSVMSSYQKALRFSSSYLEECLDGPESSFLNRIHKATIDSSMQFSYSVAKEIQSLFRKVLQEYLVKDRLTDSQKSAEEMLENKSFLKSLLVCSFECYLFVKNIISLQLESVLTRFEVTPFDFWKQIHTFAFLLKQIPKSFLVFLSQLESKILNKMIWSANSGFSETIKSIRKQDGLSSSARLILRKVYHFSDERVYKYCSEIGLSQSVSEEIWVAVQYFLSEQTEHLLSSSIDELILCAVYSVCKPLGVLSVNQLIQKFLGIYLDADIGPNTQCFYNKTFALVMKRSNEATIQPRIPELMQHKPLLKPVQEEVFSPAWLTPRLGNACQNSTIKKASRRINFDNYESPVKKFK